MPPEIDRWRRALRAELLARRLAVSSSDCRAATATITRTLTELFPILQWVMLGLYWPIKGEIDPRFAARNLRNHGCKTALPEVFRKGEPLRFREWWPGVNMAKGVYDLPVPRDTAVVLPRALLIPPVGFDENGYRLGYGGGYFDRTLASMRPQPLKIGVAFELSRIPTIHPLPHDVPMDFIVTETGIHHVGAHGLETLADSVSALEIIGEILSGRDLAGDGTTGADDGGASLPGERTLASPVCYLDEMNHQDK
jgi:5,10-methenyltetrahydrofolate synthetase